MIKVVAGGYRNPSSVETLKEKVVDEYGNIRTDEHGSINGADVFSFVLKEIPKSIEEILKYSNTRIDNFDFVIFHQANKFMNNYLLKKLKLNRNKVPSTIEKFGNTSSVSIPLTIADQLKDKLQGNKKLLLSGFGVGMSWATAVINSKDLSIAEIVEV